MPSTMIKPEKREQAMCVRLPSELHEAIRERADAEDRTLAQLIRVALRYYLANAGPVA